MRTGAAFSLDDIPREPAAPDGTRSATLAGDRSPGTLFSYAFAIPAGVWDHPHSHPADAHLVVARGELRLGYGPVLAPEAAARYPAGSFLRVPAGAVHFDGAEEDTVLIGTAVGPWSTDYASGRAPG
jgi:quercetin dioxygenase-like cupin family protein